MNKQSKFKALLATLLLTALYTGSAYAASCPESLKACEAGREKQITRLKECGERNEKYRKNLQSLKDSGDKLAAQRDDYIAKLAECKKKCNKAS